MLAAALLGSGAANATNETLYASPDFEPHYTSGSIELCRFYDFGKLVVNESLTLTSNGYLDLYNGATLAFSKENGADAICRIYTSDQRKGRTVYFNTVSTFDITFDAGAQAIIAASNGTPITLIKDLNTENDGFNFCGGDPDLNTFTLNGVEPGKPVEMNGVQFTYVGPQADDYTFKAGEIGFTGYYLCSHALKLVANGKPTPEPTTGTLSLLALAGLCIRRRK